MSASVTTFRTTAETELAAQFAAMTPTTNLAQRKEAFRRIAENGLPTRRVEAWHYTDLRAQMKSAAPLAHEPAAAWKNKRPWSLVQGDAVFSFVDGWLMSAPKLPEGVTCTSFAGDSEKFNRSVAAGFDLSEDAIASLNAAFMTGGLLIEVAAGVVVEQPLSLAFETTDATASCARVVIVLAEGASLSVIETHRGAANAASQENTVITCTLGKAATLEHLRVNATDLAAQTLSTLAFTVAEMATFNTLSFTTGARLSRHQVFAKVHGNDAHVGVRGVTLIRGKQHADSTLVVEHDALNGISRELFKTVVDDEARGVFQGKIIVKPHAQKTDGQMASNALLLGEFASMCGKPELEIFADDVVCAHGATVGDLDENLLFYLRSRGIERKEAEALMVQAFAGAALEHVSHEGLRDALVEMTTDWLKARGQ